MNSSIKLPQALADKYQLGRVIGEGNFSIVHECLNLATGEIYAIKCVNKQILNDKDTSHLKHEIEILKRLDHPNIIKLYDVYEDIPTRMCYLIMEYAKGGELFDRIITKEYYTEAEAKRVVYTVAKTLYFCHSHGITHRDLKPENILYSDSTEHATIKIADFGFANLSIKSTINCTDSNPLGPMSTTCGTPGYYAPEIVRKLPYDNKCDIWSLGVITYILLCGFPPFYDENSVEEMRKILHGEYEFVKPFFDGVSDEAKDLVSKMLVVDPANRLNCEMLLNHPWLKACEESSSDTNMSQRTLLPVGAQLKNVKRLTARNRFRAGVGAIIAVKKTQRLLNIRRAEISAAKQLASSTYLTGDQANISLPPSPPIVSEALSTAIPTVAIEQQN